MDDKRLVNIETKIAYQEHMISQLNTVVIEQQAMIDDLQKTTQALSRRVLELSESMAITDRGNEKPPHY